MPVKIHPAANIFPMMSDAEFANLVEDIRINGLTRCIHFRGDSWETAELIDGRNRLRAITQLGLNYQDHSALVPCSEMPDPLAFVISLNLHRRHLTDSQRAMVAAKIANMTDNDATGSDEPQAVTQKVASEMLNVKRESVKRAAKVDRDGTEELKAEVSDGTLKVATAAKIAELPKEQQPAAIIEAKKPKPRPAAKPEPETVRTVDPKPKEQRLAPLRELFDSLTPEQSKPVDAFAEWCLEQNNIDVIHNGATLWTEWK